MKITMELPQLTIIFDIILFVSSASIPNKCNEPNDLKVRYERLSNAANGHHFFLSAENAPNASSQSIQIHGNSGCPKATASVDDLRERSTCPWYLKTINNSTMFPPLRSEVVCRCKDCIGSNNNYQCVTIKTEMTFLERTGDCIDGLYLYKSIKLYIPTACACARIIDVITDSNDYEH